MMLVDFISFDKIVRYHFNLSDYYERIVRVYLREDRRNVNEPVRSSITYTHPCDLTTPVTRITIGPGYMNSHPFKISNIKENIMVAIHTCLSSK